MNALILVLALLLPSFVFADTQCITLEGSSLTNRCQTCMEVTVHELRPPAEQTAGVYSGVSRTVRVEARGRETLQGRGSWMIGDLKECR
jgi:hypothetical protein